ncbi:MAG: M56 family metallopeptidase, partial [Pseudomonadota bacterium]
MLIELIKIGQGLVAFSLVLALQIGLVLLLRKPVRTWLGAAACYRLWLLPLLWLPFYLIGPKLFATLASLNFAIAQNGSPQQSALQQWMKFELLPFNFSTGTAELTAGNLGFAASYGWAALTLIWLAGSVALIVWQGRRWRDFSRHVSKLALPLPASERQHSGAVTHFDPGVPVLCLQGMRSAALFGIFKPVLLLPESFSQRYDNNQRHIILAHEAVHLRRKDNCWNLCALLLLTLFWTNPLVLLAWRYYRLDQELSCDALALTHCNREQQQRYARTLLDSLGSLPASGTQPALSAWDNLRDLKERSIMIKHHLLTATRPATTVFSLILLALFGASLTITFAELVSPPLQAAEPAPTQQTATNTATSERTAKILKDAVELMNQNKPEEALVALEPLWQQIEQGQLSNYENSRVGLIAAHAYTTLERYPEALAAMERNLALQGLTEAERTATTYAIAQTYIRMEDWPKAVESLSRWLATPGREGPGPLYLLAVAHYQLQQYEEALPYIERTLELAGEKPQEAWHQLRHGIFVKTNRIAEARSSLEKMVELYDDDASSKYQTMLNELNAANPEA